MKNRPEEHVHVIRKWPIENTVKLDEEFVFQVFPIMPFFFCFSSKDDNYVPVMKESSIDVKALSNAYKEKKRMRDNSNVVKIGKRNNFD